MKKVLINESFRDKYTGQVYEAGKIYTLSNERVAEIKEVNKKLIEVIGNAEDCTEIDTGVVEVPGADVIVDDVTVDDEIVDDEVVDDVIVDDEVVPEETSKKSTRKK